MTKVFGPFLLVLSSVPPKGTIYKGPKALLTNTFFIGALSRIWEVVEITIFWEKKVNLSSEKKLIDQFFS